MQRLSTLICIICVFICTAIAQITPSSFALDDIILDIYRTATEMGEIDYEQLQTDLYSLHESPINLNATTEEELSQLPFLSPQQIDELLAYADKHPFASLYELRLIHSLADYDIRNLLPFVRIGSAEKEKMYTREVFHYAQHELLTRVDARNIESFEGTDPMYGQLRYRFDYKRRVVFGLQLRRPAGSKASELQYNAYIQLKDIGPMHTIVAGSFQASFGQGLVLAPVFRSGKSSYVQSVGMANNGLRYYSSADGEGLQGAGGTYRHVFNAHTRLHVSALYSIKKANDSTLHHLVGANMTLRHRKLEVQLTAIENIWSDSIRPYRNSAYNQHYFRGTRQAVIGASVRYNHGWFDLFGEVATAQNYDRSTLHPTPSALHPRWGFGGIIGSRFYPTEGVALTALYRYYSPYFDNALGYAFSESSRIGDENGGYIGFDVSRWKGIRWTGYADIFYFSGPKYGIPQYPTIGYDAMTEIRFNIPHHTSNIQHHTSNIPPSTLHITPSTSYITLRLRARDKGDLATYSTRLQYDWQQSAWSLRTTAEANLTTSYGYTVYQDIAYDFAQSGLSVRGKALPLSLRLRVQFFDAREWDNRIYTYEHDVLYAFSIPAVYGLGGRAYVCLRWQAMEKLSLYLRVSETLYQRAWYQEHHSDWNGAAGSIPTRTDVHLLLRWKL
ncbi:MAG: helix-hairpin-helix domain-containing protein [Paludibacteraceae bacterium]|nr:helix-hairpin-helix domain-containing protein [Paludibacteraceae bacterium]